MNNNMINKRSDKSDKMTIDKLAIMVAKGFESVATKEDIKDMATKTNIEELKSQVEGINKRIDNKTIRKFICLVISYSISNAYKEAIG